MTDFYLGQIFTETYPDEAALFCDERNYLITSIEPIDNKKRFQITALPEPTPEEIQELIDNLTMTPLDFIGVLQSLGLTLEQITNFLDEHLEIKTQLTYCNNVYCGVVKSFLPITVNGITITPSMVEQAFKLKNGVQQ